MPISETEALAASPPDPPANKRRSEAVQRLQVGLAGLAAMVLLVGLANILQDRARSVEEDVVPEAAVGAEEAQPPSQPDPLADAGIVPDVPADSQADDAQAGSANSGAAKNR